MIFTSRWKKAGVKFLVVCFFCLWHGMTWGEPEIQLQGMFDQSVRVTWRGQSLVLKQGELHDSGLMLNSTSDSSALISYQGENFVVRSSKTARKIYSSSGYAKVYINKDEFQEFHSDAHVNGRAVKVRVDDQFDLVALNEHTAQQLGLEYRKAGSLNQAITAKGIVKSYNIVIDSIVIGDLEVKRVKAVVLEGKLPSEMVLGQAFLGMTDMHIKTSHIELKAKY